MMRDVYQRSHGIPSFLLGGSGASGWSSRASNSSNMNLTSSDPPPSFLTASTLFQQQQYGGPTKLLNEKIRARDWDGARVRVLSHPLDAHFRICDKKHRSSSSNNNNSTSLHLACLFRAPYDVVQMIMDANPYAVLSQDSEGWTPLHVQLLYGHDDETTLLLIRRGGSEAVSIQSEAVGSPLCLALRHGSSTTVIKELLLANPSMAMTANAHASKPARILWHQFSRNPENERFLYELHRVATINPNQNQNQNHIQYLDLPDERQALMRDFVDRLSLLLQAVKGKHYMSGFQRHYSSPDQRHSSENAAILHDVIVSTEETLGDLSHFISLIVLLYPEQVRTSDEYGNFPLHKAASNRRSSRGLQGNLRRPVSMPSFTSAGLTAVAPHESSLLRAQQQQQQHLQISDDPLELLLQKYPMAASIPNSQGWMPLHIALTHGRRTWRTGIAIMVVAAPEALLTRCVETKLLPFQLAASTDTRGSNNNDLDDVEVIETILELLLACPHAMTSAQ